MKFPILSVEANIDEVMWPNRLMLTSVGMWPVRASDGNFARVFAYFRLCFTIFFAFFIVIPQSITVYKYWGDIKLIAEISSVMLEVMLMLYKMFYVLLRQDQFKRTYRLLGDLWSLARNQEERNAVAEYAEQSKLCTMVFFYSGVADIIVFVGSSVAVCLRSYIPTKGSQHNHRHLPLPLWYGIDIQPSPGFEVLLVSQILGLIGAAITVIACDTTMMAIIMQFVGQFKLVGLRLEAIGRETREGAHLDSDPSNALRRQLRLCIQHHQRVLSAFQQAEELLNPLTFGQLVLASLLVCMCGFRLTESDSSAPDLVRFSVLIVSVFVQLAIFCWPGELVWRESAAVAEVAFQRLAWFAMPWRLQRDLALLALRAQQRPCQVSALGIQIMCLRKLSEIFNSALSFMALLRSMRE